MTYLAPGKEVIRSAPLMTLEILKIDQASGNGMVGDGRRQGVCIFVGVGHTAVVVYITYGAGRVGRRVIDAAVRAERGIGDEGCMVEGRIECVSGREGRRPGEEGYYEGNHV